MADWFMSALSSFWEAVSSALQSASDAILGLLATAIDAALVEAGVQGGTASFDLGFVGDILTIGNQWLPLDLGLSLLTAYIGWSIAFISIKMVLKITPFVG